MKLSLVPAIDGQFGLDESVITDIKEKAKANGIDNPSQKSYFVNVNRNPLLTVYVVELKNNKDNADGSEAKEEWKKYEGRTVVGFGVGIPSLSDQETKYARIFLTK